MAEASVRLSAEHLAEAEFARFGRVIARPDRNADASGPGWRWWGETLALPADDRRYCVGLLDLAPAEPRFDWAERHMRSVEAIVPVGGDCLVYVGPPDALDEPGALPPLDAFRVFRVPQGRGVVLDKGVWHGAPLAAGAPLHALVLLLEGTGRADTTVVRFEHNPVSIAMNL